MLFYKKYQHIKIKFLNKNHVSLVYIIRLYKLFVNIKILFVIKLYKVFKINIKIYLTKTFNYIINMIILRYYIKIGLHILFSEENHTHKYY